MKLRFLISGKPSVLIKNGKIDQREMKKNRFTVDELAEELRKKEITDISTVQYAILETDGTVSTVLFPSERPVTAGQLDVNVEDRGYPVMLINNGRILSENLKAVGRNEKWLSGELKKRGISSHNEVYVMILENEKENDVYVVRKEI